ncbi:unnamed protein product [Durusdinium trenchii]|uniref:Protein kinase domain-containing protein n=1 Tax=Durusdinium trenchii TaxID=1381693 RepID=A0ABP0LMH2_9DINO
MSTMRRRSSCSGAAALARLPLRMRPHYDKEVLGGGESPAGRGSISTKSSPAKTRDISFFTDGVQSETVGGFARTRQNSCSTIDSASPKQNSATVLERRPSRGSLLDSSTSPTPKSVALLLASCMQSGLDGDLQEARPIYAASGLVLKSPSRSVAAEKMRTIRQRTSPAFFTASEPGSPMSSSGCFDFPVVKTFRELEKEKIFDLYQWSEVLQEAGDGGKVVVCEPKPDYDSVPAETYVLKMRSKQSLREHKMEEQFRKSLMTLLNLAPHPGVLPLQEVLEDQQFYYIVMEKAKGGSLFKGLLKQFEDGHMPPTEVRRLIRGILEAIGYIHEHGMLHRDIKPDNLVMRDVQSDAMEGGALRVAIIDFDHADPEYLSKPKPMDSEQPSCDYFCGTVQFSAPEAFMGCFSPASDLYSIGIILYLIMAGKMPFDNSIFQEEMSVLQQSPKSRGWTMNLWKRLKSQAIDWSCDPWPQQPECASFCRWLLAFEPSKRPSSAAEALEHDWFVASVGIS